MKKQALLALAIASLVLTAGCGIGKCGSGSCSPCNGKRSSSKQSGDKKRMKKSSAKKGMGAASDAGMKKSNGKKAR